MTVPEAAQRGVRLHERFLHDVLRVRSGAEEDGGPHRRGRMTAHQVGVRVGVTGAHAGQDLGVVVDRGVPSSGLTRVYTAGTPLVPVDTWSAPTPARDR